MVKNHMFITLERVVRRREWRLRMEPCAPLFYGFFYLVLRLVHSIMYMNTSFLFLPTVHSTDIARFVDCPNVVDIFVFSFWELQIKHLWTTVIKTMCWNILSFQLSKKEWFGCTRWTFSFLRHCSSITLPASHHLSFLSLSFLVLQWNPWRVR